MFCNEFSVDSSSGGCQEVVKTDDASEVHACIVPGKDSARHTETEHDTKHTRKEENPTEKNINYTRKTAIAAEQTTDIFFDVDARATEVGEDGDGRSLRVCVSESLISEKSHVVDLSVL